jgi:hypothetical protein
VALSNLLYNEYGEGDISKGVKGPGSEADHSLPTSSLVKKTWIYTFTPSVVLS